MNRKDIITEMASDMVRITNDFAKRGYLELHSWLQPILIQFLEQSFSGLTDEDVLREYNDTDEED